MFLGKSSPSSLIFFGLGEGSADLDLRVDANTFDDPDCDKVPFARLDG